jgi:Tti2 family
MEDILYQLQGLLDSEKSPQDTLPILQKCISLFSMHDGGVVTVELPNFQKELLASIIKPLFASTRSSSIYKARSLDSPRKLWRDSATWSLDIFKWILDNYGTLQVSQQKQAIESHFPLLVPPLLALLDDDNLTQKKRGCDFLQVLCSCLVRCESGVLSRTGLTKVFEDSLAHNMFLLPSLTPEEQSVDVLSSLYPAYRALVNASFGASFSIQPSNASKLTSVAQGRHHISRGILSQHYSRQAMLDRLLRSGLLAGYVHASDYVQIATLLLSEVSSVLAMMGAASAKYLSEILPLLRSILTNPLGTAYPPLLKSATSAMRQLILHCWPRIAEVWWEECARTIIGLWLVLSNEDDSTLKTLREDTKGLMDLLWQVRGQAQVRKDLCLSQAEYCQLEGLVSPD